MQFFYKWWIVMKLNSSHFGEMIHHDIDIMNIDPSHLEQSYIDTLYGCRNFDYLSYPAAPLKMFTFQDLLLLQKDST